MDPVEERPHAVSGGAAHQSQERLDEAETHRDKTNEGVGVGEQGLGDALDLQQDEDEAGDGEAPGDHHEGAMPDEPLVQVVTGP